jgi:diguanylate cyclase (GGDEF)-like protein/PAS domain S-box-containing protein
MSRPNAARAEALSATDPLKPQRRQVRLTAAALVLAAALGALLALAFGGVDVAPGIGAGLAPMLATAVAVGLLLTLLMMRRDLQGSAVSDGGAWFDAIDVGVALYNADDRLVRCNQAFVALYPECAQLLRPGIAYEDMLRAYFPVAPAEVTRGLTLAQFIADAHEQRRGKGFSEVVRRQKGDWLLMTDCRTGDGGVLSLRRVISEPQVLDLELRQRRRAVDELAELTGDWFWRTDADGRFVEFSPSLQAACGLDPERLVGLRREELPGFEPEAADLAAYERARATHAPFQRFRYRFNGAGGAPVWVATSGRPLVDGEGRFIGYYGMGRNITDHESTILALRQSRERFRALTELATEWYWETDAELRFVEVRGPGGIASILDAALRGKPVDFLLGHRRYRFNRPALDSKLAAREGFRRERFSACRPDGSTAYFEMSGEPMVEGQRFFGFRGLVWDVTERESLLARVTESEARFRALTALSSDWYWEMDGELRITSVKAGGAASAVDTTDLIGRALWDSSQEPVQPASWDELRALLGQHLPFREVLLRRRDRAGGPTQFSLVSGDPVLDAAGQFIGYRGIGKNITDQVRAQERIERLAKVDPLTQLANRQSFDERAQRVLDAAYAEGRQCALLFVDLDNFRLLNNGYGHRVGDRVLAMVANRMRAVVGEPNLLGRRGGDELVVLLTDVPRPEVAVEVAQQLIKSISEPERVLGMEVSVTPSLGIAFFPNDGADLDSLLNAADAAMYQAKDAGRKTYAFYTPAVARRVDLRLRLEQRLRRALESRDFRLFYQPLVSLVDGKMIGAEALIRWKDAELGDISPGEFIPIAEESGLIIGLGDWVIREACRARRVWRGLGLDLPPIAINFSSVQLRQIGCVEAFLEVLAEFEVQPGDIEIEVTETGLLDISSAARENLTRMRNAGVKIALDDFGVGFSSLSHLRDLPINRLKIDRSFTVECMRDARTLTIVKAVIEMARSLGIAVTAEGIETQAQQTWMQHLGCDSAQGFLFSRPIPADDFLRLFLDKRGVGRERSLMH